MCLSSWNFPGGCMSQHPTTLRTATPIRTPVSADPRSGLAEPSRLLEPSHEPASPRSSGASKTPLPLPPDPNTPKPPRGLSESPSCGHGTDQQGHSHWIFSCSGDHDGIDTARCTYIMADIPKYAYFEKTVKDVLLLHPLITLTVTFSMRLHSCSCLKVLLLDN